MINRVELKDRAKKAFKANYWMSVLIAFLLSFVTASTVRNTVRSDGNSIGDFLRHLLDTYGVNVMAIVASLIGAVSLIGVVISLLCKVFITNPYEVGLKYFFVKNEYGKPTFSDAFSTFTDNYVNVCKVIFMKNLMVGLWSLLLVIPGIIKALEYSQVEYIVADDHSVDWRHALEKSSRITKGKKLDILILELSFIGWELLSFIPFLQILWVAPYKNQTMAELYLSIKYDY